MPAMKPASFHSGNNGSLLNRRAHGLDNSPEVGFWEAIRDNSLVPPNLIG